LGTRFTEEEVWLVIKGLEPDKAPSPDGFTTLFFQAAWPVIRHDLMSAFDTFWHLDMRHLHTKNDALMVLLPKTDEAAIVKDYHPIALIHSVGKLITKVLPNRLALKLGELVHVSQNVFVKGGFIHDSYKLMQASTRKLHARKVLCLLLKDDIARAFDSVSSVSYGSGRLLQSLA
jgi:hypothetical protein